MARLTARDRESIAAMAMAGMAVASIAMVMGCSPRSVRAALPPVPGGVGDGSVSPQPDPDPAPPVSDPGRDNLPPLGRPGFSSAPARGGSFTTCQYLTGEPRHRQFCARPVTRDRRGRVLPYCACHAAQCYLPIDSYRKGNGHARATS